MTRNKKSMCQVHKISCQQGGRIMNFLKLSPPEVVQSCRVIRNNGCALWRECSSESGPGSGAGKGGGAGGSVKESGGGLGRYAAAQEEGFFYNKQKEQIEKMKQKLKSEESTKTQPKDKPEK
nr:ATPase inhibitor mai-1, mitochondrial-like [Plodia interpunctella]